MTREIVTRLTAVSPGVLEVWNQTGHVAVCDNHNSVLVASLTNILSYLQFLFNLHKLKINTVHFCININ